MSAFDQFLYDRRHRTMIRALFWLGMGWRGKAFALVCFAMGLAAVLSAAVPYEPYNPKSVEVLPDAVCGGAEVGILTTREWRENWHQQIDTVRVSAQWQDVDTGALYPSVNGLPSAPTLSHPTGTVKADLRFPTPNEPGEYELLFQYDIVGSVLVTPRHQDVPPNPRDWLHSKNTLTVKACE